MGPRRKPDPCLICGGDRTGVNAPLPGPSLGQLRGVLCATCFEQVYYSDRRAQPSTAGTNQSKSTGV